jgi:hypothetical protein
MLLPLFVAALLAPADAPQDGKLYLIKAVHSGKALAPTADGTGVEQADAKPDDEAQHWKLMKVGDAWRVIHPKSDKTVGLPDEADDATPLTLAKAKRGTRQQWAIEKKGKGFVLTSKATGQVWDITEASGDDGAKLIQYPSKGDEDADNQRFELVPVAGK